MRGDPARLLLAMREPARALAGQVLHERAAARHVERLHAAADGEDRQAAPLGRADERQLERVDLPLGRPERRVRRLAVGRGVQVGAAGQQQTVEPRDEQVDDLGQQRREDHGHRPRALERLRVGEAERELAHRRLGLRLPARGLGHAQLGRRETDERPEVCCGTD